MHMSRAKKYAKRGLRRLHPATKAIMALALLLGVVIGAAGCLLLSKNDRFLLKGGAGYTLTVTDDGTPFAYAEEGVEAYCFGLDVSGSMKAETSLEKDENGNYLIPTDKAGVYTITYTVDCFKFGENAPNGVIKRIRTFTVTEQEESNG
jgi:hypothetical protein